MLTQAAGRAGRGNKPGEVVIQTYQPEHYSIVHAARQDYEGFYEEEMAYREFMQYPPVAHLLAVLITSGEQEAGALLCEKMTELVKKMADPDNSVTVVYGEHEAEKQPWSGIQVIGPAEATIGKINDLYRHVFYVRHADYQILVEVKDRLEQFCKEQELKNQTVQYDFDPMNTY